LKTKHFQKSKPGRRPPKYGQIRTKIRTIAVRIYQQPRLFHKLLVLDRVRNSGRALLLFSVLVERGYGDITPEVHADVAGVAQDKGRGSRRLYWRVPFREDPKPEGPALVLARGGAPSGFECPKGSPSKRPSLPLGQRRAQTTGQFSHM
jgi:hypothetical protein